MQALLQIEDDVHELIGGWKPDGGAGLLLESSHLPLLLICLLFELLKLFRDRRGTMPVRNEIDQLVQLLSQLFKPSSLLSKRTVPFPSELPQAFGDLFTSKGESLVRQQPVSELVQQPGAQDALADRDAILACAALLVRFAAVVGIIATSPDCHLATAGAAAQKAAEEIGGASAREILSLGFPLTRARVEFPSFIEASARVAPESFLDNA